MGLCFPSHGDKIDSELGEGISSVKELAVKFSALLADILHSLNQSSEQISNQLEDGRRLGLGTMMATNVTVPCLPTWQLSSCTRFLQRSISGDF